LAKEVLAEERRILLPPLHVAVGDALLQEAARKRQILKSRFVAIPTDLATIAVKWTPILGQRSRLIKM
jgi:hypothetical protein